VTSNDRRDDAKAMNYVTTLVSKQYPIDENELAGRAEGSDYWRGAYEFWLSIKNKLFVSITPKQQAWLQKIEEDLEK
jgi:hypothetical protein